MKADRRHYVGAILLLTICLALFWGVSFGRDRTRPTIPAPAGGDPVTETPPITPGGEKEKL